MFELKHLKTLSSLSRTHSLANTARELSMTHSALSHQIRDLENRIGCSLFERKSMPINFSVKGKMIMDLAEQVLPLVSKTEQSLLSSGLLLLRISVECHACFQWLVPAIKAFKTTTGPEFEIDFISETIYSSEQALRQKQAEIVFTSDALDNPNLVYEQIGEFEMVLVMSPQHELAQKAFIAPCDLLGQILLTYPVDSQKLDVFRLFLQPAGINPKQCRKVSENNVLVQMVAADMGIAALPYWAVSHYQQQGLVVTRPLTETGMIRKLYGAFRAEDSQDDNLQRFIQLSKEQFGRL